MQDNAYLRQAQCGRNEFWRYLVVNTGIIGVSFGVSIILVIIAFFVEGTLAYQQFSPLTLLWVSMLPFPFALAGLWAGIRFLHGRSLRSLITPWERLNWKRLLFSAGGWFLLSGLIDGALAFIQPGNYVFSFNWRDWLPYFLLSFILIPIQTSTEELLFRGYLPQGLSLLTKGVWLPLIVPSAVFGLLHGLNPEVGLYGMALMLPTYIVMGLFLGWITLRSQSLELSLGVHWANNLYAGLVVTFPGSSLASPAIFSIREFDPLPATIGLLLAMGLYLLVAGVLGGLRPPQMQSLQKCGQASDA
jgi:membrane protease YdiL (CAAX protease family)